MPTLVKIPLSQAEKFQPDGTINEQTKREKKPF